VWRRSERYSDGGVDQNGIGATLRSINGEGGDAAVDQRGGATLASIIGGGDGGVDHQRGGRRCGRSMGRGDAGVDHRGGYGYRR
jgi:hypothetical protein